MTQRVPVYMLTELIQYYQCQSIVISLNNSNEILVMETLALETVCFVDVNCNWFSRFQWIEFSLLNELPVAFVFYSMNYKC